MKKIFLPLIALMVLGLPAAASAGTITFQAPATAPDSSPGGNNPGGPNQVDLDHHRAYTWRINGITIPQGQVITGASLTFNSISNWDANPNRLFIHLLDTASNWGIASFQDTWGLPTPVPMWQIVDNFAGVLYTNYNPLVAQNTANTYLGERSFTTTPETFVLTFSAQQIQILTSYILNGNDIAFGLDPDCHFWNNGITLNITTGLRPTNQTQPVPEPTTLALLGTGLGGLYLRRRRRQKQQQQQQQ